MDSEKTVSSSGRGMGTGAGRKPGVPNKATAEVKAIAQQHGPKAIEVLADLMFNAQNDQARIAACKELLDRAYGKAKQSIDANVTGDMVFNILTGVPRA